MVTVVVVWPGPMGNRASTPYLPRLTASNQSFKVPGTNEKWTADSNNNNIEILIKTQSERRYIILFVCHIGRRRPQYRYRQFAHTAIVLGRRAMR